MENFVGQIIDIVKVMENFVAPIADIVKVVGDPIVRYLEYQTKFNDHLVEYNARKEDLSRRKRDIRSRLDTDLQCPCNVAKEEVKKWLEDVEEFIARQDVVDEVNDQGCLSCCCRVKILEERTQQLREIYGRGHRYTNECLVVEDQSKKFAVYVENFKDLKERLQCRQQDINSMLRSQLGYGKMAKEEVKKWLKDVKEITGRVANDIEDQINNSQSLSNAPTAHLANLLNEKIQEMKRTYEEGGRLTESLVVDDPSASKVELPTSELQGSEDVKAEILACLMGDKVTKVGVWGMGGIGKTTIMKHIHNELLKKAKFKKVIWVTVSQTFDIRNLQEQIASSLKEQLQRDQNTIVRAANLSKMLEGHKPYVLILDDVWDPFELGDAGIPELLDGCKLVLTTRSQEVAWSMGCTGMQVKTLSQGEALKLFLNKVGDIVLLGLKPTLKEIVNECDGLPLAIVIVASSLKEISDPRLWKVALNQLRECKRNVAGTDVDAFRILKFSYDRLTNLQIQHCFLYCAMYPEDYNIPKEEIIEYWIDEGFIDERETWRAMKDEGYCILKKLEDNCLLESTCAYEKDCVSMHDLVRDMALNITRTSPRFLVKAGLKLKKLPEKGEWRENLEKISLMRNNIEEIPSNILSSKCTMLTTLLLSHNNLSTIPESVLEYMPQLKILDLSYNAKLSSLPNSLSKLVNLTTLLLHRTSLTEVPSLSDLQALKKLDLGQSILKEIPEGLEMLTNLKYLHISSYQVSPQTDERANEILSNLSKLQCLEVGHQIALKGEVIGGLVKLEGFGGRLSTWHELNIFVKCLQDRGDGDGLSMYAISVSSYWPPLELEEGRRMLEFIDIDIDGENISLLPSVQQLFIKRCNNVRSLNDISAIKDAKELNCCSIYDCNGMECVLSSSINPLVQKLEVLALFGLEKLDALFEAEAITESPLPPDPFSSLKTIFVQNCVKIKKLFPFGMNLQSLEEIEIRHCEQMEEIIAWDAEEAGGEKEGLIQIILPKLKRLELMNLRGLRSICSRRAVMVCDSLEQIQIWECKGLRRIPLYLRVRDNGRPSPPPSLKQISVWPTEWGISWWESLEWDHPNAKDVLLPFCEFS